MVKETKLTGIEDDIYELFEEKSENETILLKYLKKKILLAKDSFVRFIPEIMEEILCNGFIDQRLNVYKGLRILDIHGFGKDDPPSIIPKMQEYFK